MICEICGSDFGEPRLGNNNYMPIYGKNTCRNCWRDNITLKFHGEKYLRNVIAKRQQSKKIPIAVVEDITTGEVIFEIFRKEPKISIDERIKILAALR